MKLINYKIFLLIFLFISLSLEQRGGGSRSSSRSSSSRSSSRRSSSWGSGRRRYRSSGGGSIFSWFSSNTTDNSTETQGDESNQSGGSGFLIVIGVIGVIGGLAYVGSKEQAKRQVQRKQRIEELFVKFQGQCQQNPCTLNDSQVLQLKDWFMQHKWAINFRTNDGTFFDTANVTVKGIQNKSTYVYRFQMSLRDSIGSSEATGVLAHRADFLSIKFEKTYNNRTQAGQTGSYDLLIYEGVQQGQVFRGKWYYKNFEMNQSYSGTWEMIHS